MTEALKIVGFFLVAGTCPLTISACYAVYYAEGRHWCSSEPLYACQLSSLALTFNSSCNFFVYLSRDREFRAALDCRRTETVTTRL